MRRNRETLQSNMEFMLISLFLIYSMWFQYGVTEINSFLSVIGILLFAAILFKNEGKLNVEQYRPVGILFVFLLYALVAGVLFSGARSEVVNLLLQIVKYMLPMIAMIDYVGCDFRKLKKLSWVIAIVGILLSYSIITKGVVQSNSGVTISDLNTNVLVSYLILVLVSITFLFYDSKGYKRVILLVDFALSAIAIINAASRRGAIVFAFISIMYIYIYCNKSGKERWLSKLLMATLVVCGLVYVANEISYLGENNPLVLRLMGKGDVSASDSLRRYYKMKALELFFRRPIVGNGLGYVGISCGMHSHSMYHELLACTGIVGTGIMFVFGIKSLVMLNRNRKRVLDTNRLICTYITIVFFISIVLSAYQATYIYDSYFYIMLAVIACVINVNRLGTD